MDAPASARSGRERLEPHALGTARNGLAFQELRHLMLGDPAVGSGAQVVRRQYGNFIRYPRRLLQRRQLLRVFSCAKRAQARVRAVRPDDDFVVGEVLEQLAVSKERGMAAELHFASAGSAAALVQHGDHRFTEGPLEVRVGDDLVNGGHLSGQIQVPRDEDGARVRKNEEDCIHGVAAEPTHGACAQALEIVQHAGKDPRLSEPGGEQRLPPPKRLPRQLRRRQRRLPACREQR